MAKQVIEKVTDDIDGSDGAQTYRFGWGADRFEVDLSDKNARKLEKALAPFINAGRIVKEPRGRKAASSSSHSRDESKAVRSWAKEQGIAVNDRGRVSQSLIERYRQSH